VGGACHVGSVIINPGRRRVNPGAWSVDPGGRGPNVSAWTIYALAVLPRGGDVFRAKVDPHMNGGIAVLRGRVGMVVRFRSAADDAGTWYTIDRLEDCGAFCYFDLTSYRECVSGTAEA
jgi:hypothetical protein